MGRFKIRSFFAGILAGVLLSALLLGGVIFYGSRQTYVVMVNTHGIAEQVDNAAGLMLAELLPEYLDRFRAEVPDLVVSQTGSPFGDAKFQLGGAYFALPSEMIAELDQHYNESLAQAVLDLLDALPADELGKELGQELTGIIENSAYANLNNRTFELDLFHNFRLPLTIRLFSDPGQQSLRILWRSNNVDPEY